MQGFGVGPQELGVQLGPVLTLSESSVPAPQPRPLPLPMAGDADLLR